MISLLRRLEVLSSQLIKENLLRQEDTISAAKITYGSWVHEIRDYILKDIFYSMASQIEVIIELNYLSIVLPKFNFVIVIINDHILFIYSASIS